jgi:farnesyl diphosphate synthase
MIDYNVPGGKLNRGMAVLDVVRALKAPEAPSTDETFKANALGWCIEWVGGLSLLKHSLARIHAGGSPTCVSSWTSFCSEEQRLVSGLPQLQAFFLVADDIMDNSITRRGQPCWYRQPKVPPNIRSCHWHLIVH